MEAKNNNFLRIALYFIFGVLGSIVAGLITFGPIMFSIGPGRQFIMVGIVGSIIFITVRFYKKWIAALIALIFPLALLISFKVFQIPLVLGIIFWALGTGFTLFGIACLFRTKIERIPFGKFLLVALALAAFYFLIALLRIGPLVKPFPISALLMNATFGFMAGGGLGFGIEVGDLLGKLFTKGKAQPVE
jgi:hypothetical protein